MSSFRKITMGELLRETASRFPENEALVSPEFGVRETYGEFLTSCTRIAKGFMAIGVEKGDHVSVWATNVPQWAHLQFALGMIGSVMVTVNTNCEPHELEYILNQSDSTTLIHIEAYRKKNFSRIVEEVIPEVKSASLGNIRSEKLPFMRNVVHIGDEETDPGVFCFEDIIRLGETVSDEELRNRELSLDTDDVVNMQYTSGTTGFPKGVMLSHYNIINNARMVAEVGGMTEADRLLIQLPLFHCFGCVVSALTCVCSGSTIVLMESFDPLKALQFVEEEKCTAVNGVPTMFIAILSHHDFNTFDLSSLRTGIMAGAPCPEGTMRDVMTKMHCPEVTIAYGMTETSPVMTMTRRDDPVDLRVSTVGRFFDGIEGKVIDPATGEDLPSNTQGEIVSRGPCVMKGYYKMPEATEATIDAAGWMHSGDLGTVDENGYFRITGRIKDLIIRGGENIYPREIEDFLYKHPKVKDVYVVGVPDDKYGEQILASIALKDDETAAEEEFAKFCADKIARFKIPKYWEFNVPLPLTASGKVQKFKLAEQFVARNER
ncbi:MAG: AMP-binding protein [Syntrophobacterales bacterium]|nr:MAG: AMP-binding protein [Syntrophobacterales bacterium]